MHIVFAMNEGVYLGLTPQAELEESLERIKRIKKGVEADSRADQSI
jgi:hypothetical protein